MRRYFFESLRKRGERMREKMRAAFILPRREEGGTRSHVFFAESMKALITQQLFFRTRRGGEGGRLFLCSGRENDHASLFF